MAYELMTLLALLKSRSKSKKKPELGATLARRLHGLLFTVERLGPFAQHISTPPDPSALPLLPPPPALPAVPTTTVRISEDRDVLRVWGFDGSLHQRLKYLASMVRALGLL